MAAVSEGARARLRTAQELLQRDRASGLDALNEIFRMGSPPQPPPDGSYPGEMLTFTRGPLITRMIALVGRVWMPWRGKAFDASRALGFNIITRGFLGPARLIWPLYTRYLYHGPKTFRAFPFQTSLAPSVTDPEIQVLKLDYDLDMNPRFIIRRLLDELVQVAPGCYLGKAYLRSRRGWKQWAYFTLTEDSKGMERQPEQ